MNQKLEKKMRKLFRREMMKTAQQTGFEIANSLKPKPKWMPRRVYLFLIGFFIKLEK